MGVAPVVGSREVEFCPEVAVVLAVAREVAPVDVVEEVARVVLLVLLVMVEGFAPDEFAGAVAHDVRAAKATMTTSDLRSA